MAVPERDTPDDTSRDDRDRPSFLNRMVEALAEDDERENEDLEYAMGADVGTEADPHKDPKPDR